MDETKADHPGVRVFPLGMYLGTLFVGLVLHYFWPLRLGAPIWSRILGAVIAVAGRIGTQWALRTMRRAGTNVMPTRPALALVTTGPFHFSRNPIYVAGLITYLGLALAFNTAWLLWLLVPMIAVLYWGIVRYEERYLEAKFGDAYLAYKSSVRRWL